MTQRECKEIFELLSEYLDREIPPTLCSEIERHIQDCPPCVAFVDSLKKSIGLCRDLKAADPPPPLPDEVRTRLLDAWQKAIPVRS